MILRCTTRLAKLVGVSPGNLPNPDPDPDDWYVNLVWVDRRKCLLIAHAGTLFPVFVRDVRKSDLVSIGSLVAVSIRQALSAEGLPAETFGNLDPRDTLLARTASRAVLGHMNVMARVCDYRAWEEGGLMKVDLDRLNHDLRRELHLSRRPPGYVVPIDEARARVKLPPEPPRGSLAAVDSTAGSASAVHSDPTYRRQTLSEPLPELVQRRVEKELRAFCDARVPLHVRDQVRLEYSVHGHSATLVERRVPWQPAFSGEPWTRMEIAQFRFDPGHHLWRLFWRDRHNRWHEDDTPPNPDFAVLLDEVDRDPTGIYWG